MTDRQDGPVEIEDQLRDAFHRSMRGVAPPVHDLVRAAVREGRSSRPAATRVWAGGAVAAAAVVAAAVVVTTPWGDSPVGSGGTPTGANVGCRPAREAVVPSWARAGFSDPEPVVMHATSDDRRIVAILFGRVLHAPPAEDVNNKILWVARSRGADPLRIEAVHDRDGSTVHREVPGGPGPSIVDLPRAGCWHLTLQWGVAAEHRDTMDLEYVDPQAPRADQ